MFILEKVKLKFDLRKEEELTLQTDKSKTLTYAIYVTKIHINQMSK